MNEDDAVITTVEAAKILGVSRATVQVYYHKGLLPGYKMPGRTSRIRLYRKGVLQFLESLKEAAPTSKQDKTGEV
ncbi:MAG: helix-turn-helix domain-containing protein [Chloroflexi bacterium]|nr:helix-turn-helix domain-containing protein [Chloroflexota bacterium]